jgi:hypothetical protein
MKHAESLTSVAAVSSALATLACCLPLGIVGIAGVAAASASLSLVIDWLRPWPIGLSVVLLGLSGYQVYRAKGACQGRSRTSVVLLWGSVLVVGADSTTESPIETQPHARPRLFLSRDGLAVYPPSGGRGSRPGDPNRPADASRTGPAS